MEEQQILSSQHSPLTTRGRQVVQSYIATTAMYDFNVYEKRVMYNLVRLAQSQIEGVVLTDNLHKICHDMKGYVHVTLPLSDFLADEEDKNHRRVKDALKSLHRKTFEYLDDDVWECISIIALPKIALHSRQVSFIVDSRVWDVLLDFSRGFSRYDIEVAFRLESCYSMRFYELMACQKEPITYSIDALRRIFKLEDKYAFTKDFIKRVVESSKIELDQKSPVSFTYAPVKDGKRITQLIFFPVRFNAQDSSDDDHRVILRKYGPSAVLTADERRFLEEIGFNESGINNNLSLFMDCQRNLDFIYELALIKGKCRTKKNPCGWCIRTLTGKLADKKSQRA
ncbi:MAG: replication initiation protein [Bacteroidales bacterium]|nr:replication initiation protein [Bacteroidales bacterium]